MSEHRRIALVFAIVISFSIPSIATTVGNLQPIDASAGSPSAPVAIAVADIVRISIPITSVNAAAVPTVAIVSGSGLFQAGVVIKDQQTYSVFFVAQQPGTVAVAFSYAAAAGNPPVILVNYTFNISAIHTGRIIQINGNGLGGATQSLTDIATGQPPVGGVLVGDVLKYQVGNAATISNVTAGVGSGTALQFLSVVNEGTGTTSIVVAYFSATIPGSASIGVGFRTVGGGDGGFISLPIFVGL